MKAKSMMARFWASIAAVAISASMGFQAEAAPVTLENWEAFDEDSYPYGATDTDSYWDTYNNGLMPDVTVVAGFGDDGNKAGRIRTSSGSGTIGMRASEYGFSLATGTVATFEFDAQAASSGWFLSIGSWSGWTAQR